MSNEADAGATKIQMRDRIMYSPVGKFDTFPRSFFIDVVRGDPEEWVKLEEYSDRLLAFKQRKLYIINISSPSPSGWHLEDVKDFMGIQFPASVVKTEFGVAWVNQYGCFMYDGRQVRNLILNKVSESSWDSFIQVGSIIGYVPKKFYLIILKDCFADSGDVRIYDFRTDSWVSGDTSFGDDFNRANNVIDWNNNMVTLYQVKNDTANKWQNYGEKWESAPEDNDWEDLGTSSPVNVKEWSDSAASKERSSIDIRTKDIDFGEPGLIKKIYSLMCSYKSSVAQTNPLKYSTDGGTTFSDFDGDFDAVTDWSKLRATLTTPVKCQSVRLQVTNPTTSGTIEINDLGVEYRTIRKRVS
jgi:hypothetical protein